MRNERKLGKNYGDLALSKLENVLTICESCTEVKPFVSPAYGHASLGPWEENVVRNFQKPILDTHESNYEQMTYLHIAENLEYSLYSFQLFINCT